MEIDPILIEQIVGIIIAVLTSIFASDQVRKTEKYKDPDDSYDVKPITMSKKTADKYVNPSNTYQAGSVDVVAFRKESMKQGEKKTELDLVLGEVTYIDVMTEGYGKVLITPLIDGKQNEYCPRFGFDVTARNTMMSYGIQNISKPMVNYKPFNEGVGSPHTVQFGVTGDNGKYSAVGPLDVIPFDELSDVYVVHLKTN